MCFNFARLVNGAAWLAARVGVLVASAVMALSAKDAPVQVWGDTVGLPTYAEGLPSDSPHFSILDTDYNPYYPYTTRKNFEFTRTVQYWRVLHLQNEYLHCMVMPDLGGHLYRCIDLTNGHDVFHPMVSVKKRDIGLRGAWVTTGIELNFPFGHSWVSVSPVDFSWNKSEDGSASVWVGNTDRVEGMRWLVEFVLHPHSRVLEQRVTLYNRDDARHRFYWWANAAVTQEDEHTTFVYPMNLTSAEGDRSRVDTWPVTHDGQHLAQVGGYQHASGLFALNSREPFFAAYNPKSRTGVVHYADVQDVPGKKLWTWGKDQDEWARRELSDNGTNYVEIQAGVFQNQMDFGFLEPQQQKSFVEYWFPVSGLDGISRATLDATLYLGHKAGSAIVQLSANRTIAAAQLRLSQAGRVVWQATAEMDPAHAYANTVPNVQSGPLTFELMDKDGHLLLKHTENQYDAMTEQEYRSQKHAPVVQSCNSVESCLAQAKENELRGMLFFAKGDYGTAISRYGKQPELLKGAGRIAVLLKRYLDAVQLFQTLSESGTLDAESHYYFGLALAHLGRDQEARQQWSAVNDAAVFGPAAGIELACLEARSGDWKRALQTIAAVEQKWPKLTRAGELELLFLRRSGDAQRALERLTYWRGIDPADSVFRVESVILVSADEYLSAHLASDPDRVIALASHYMWVGDYADAHDLLARRYPAVPATETEPGYTLPQDNPLVAYYRGYCQQKLGGSPAADFEAASKMSTRFVFPNRPSSFDVLKAALASNINDSTAHFLLANLEMESGYVDLAIKNWEYPLQRHIVYPALYSDLAHAYLAKGDLDEAKRVAQLAATASPTNPEVNRLMDEIAKADTSGSHRRGSVNTAPIPGNPAVTALLAAADGRVQEAQSVFKRDEVKQISSDPALKESFFEVQLQNVIETAHNRNCSSLATAIDEFGEADPDYAFTKGSVHSIVNSPRAQFYLARSEALCGMGSDAKKRWRRAAGANRDLNSLDYVFPVFARVQLDALEGKEPKAELSAALNDVENALGHADGKKKSALLYSKAMLLQALGRFGDAAAIFQALAGSGEADLMYRARLGLRDNEWAASSRHRAAAK
jgi:tetratricopeptide (TPR) repeat protein